MEQAVHAFFDGLSTPVLFVALAGAVAVLTRGADWLVDGAAGLSERLGVPKVIVGATIVSMGTTAPETAVSVLAAVQGMPDFALGNAVGSIICDTGLIFGLACLLTRLPTDRFILNRHGIIQLGAGVLLVCASLLFWNADRSARVLTRPVGVAFLALLALYLFASAHWAKGRRLQGADDAGGESEAAENGAGVGKHTAFLVLGLVLVVAGSRVLLVSVQVLCVRWGVPSSVIAATLVAFGTSLPELVTALTSIRKGHKELVLGNVLGADILNVLFVTGASACAAPLAVDPLFLRLHFPVMIAVLVLFQITARASKGSFARWPGFLLVGLHLAYAVTNYVIGRS